MKDFDLAAAKRGATVCTRGGNPVRIFSFDCRKRREGGVACPIVAEVFYKGQWEFKDGNWAISDYEESGRWHGIGTESEYDLMMADDDYIEKLERGEYDHIGDGTEKVEDSQSMGDEVVENNRRFISMWYEYIKRQSDWDSLRETVGNLKSKAVSSPDNTSEYWRRERSVLAARFFMEEMRKGEEFLLRAPLSIFRSGHKTSDVASRAVEYADALIEELKKEKK